MVLGEEISNELPYNDYYEEAGRLVEHVLLLLRRLLEQIVMVVVDDDVARRARDARLARSLEREVLVDLLRLAVEGVSKLSPTLPATSCFSLLRSITNIRTTSSGDDGSSHSWSPCIAIGVGESLRGDGFNNYYSTVAAAAADTAKTWRPLIIAVAALQLLKIRIVLWMVVVIKTTRPSARL